MCYFNFTSITQLPLGNGIIATKFSMSSSHLIYMFWGPLNPKKWFLEICLFVCVIYTFEYIPFQHIPAKSPDNSLMGYCAYRVLKSAFSKSKSTLIAGFGKIKEEE